MWQHSHPWEAFFLQTVNQEGLSSLDSNSATFSHNSEPSFLPSPCKIPLMINFIKHVTTLTPPLYLALTYLLYSKASHGPVLVCTLKDIPKHTDQLWSSAATSVTIVPSPIFTQHIYRCSFLIICLWLLIFADFRGKILAFPSWNLTVFNRPTLAFSETWKKKRRNHQPCSAWAFLK